MKKILAAVFLLLILSTGAMAADHAIVVSAIAPVLSVPDSTAVRTDELLYGTIVVVNSQEVASGYSHITTSYGFSGYVASSDLLIDAEKIEDWKKKVNHRIVFPQGDIAQTNRTGSNSYKVGTLPKGALLQVTSADAWGYTLEFPVPFIQHDETAIGTADGARYIKTQAVRPINADFELATISADAQAQADFAGAVVSDALSYCDYADTHAHLAGEMGAMGTMAAPYRVGGRTHRGMDAEGFVSMAYMLNDVAMPRSSELSAPLVRIDPSKAVPGDVIFWKSHQAIYLGDNKYVHANPVARKVTVNSLVPGDPLYVTGYDRSNIVAWGNVFAEPTPHDSGSSGCNSVGFPAASLLLAIPLLLMKKK